MIITHYDILKVTPNASLTVISAAYNALCKKYHPDNYPDEAKRAKAAGIIKRLNVAYGILSDAEKRKTYDESIGITAKVEVISKDEAIVLTAKQTNNEQSERPKSDSIFKQVDFNKIKGDISQSVENVKTDIQHSINEKVISKIDLNKAKENITQSVESAKTLAAEIEHSVHENVEKIDFEAIKSGIKEKMHAWDSNAEIKESENFTENQIIGDDFYQNVTIDNNSSKKDKNNQKSIKFFIFAAASLLILIFIFTSSKKPNKAKHENFEEQFAYGTDALFNKNTNCELAISWLSKSAEQGYVEAQGLLSMMYDGKEKSDKFPSVLSCSKQVKDTKKALYWLHKAAENNNSLAQGVLSDYYGCGVSIPKNYDDAIYWAKKSLENVKKIGDTDLDILIKGGTMMHLSLLYNQQGNTAQSEYWRSKAIENSIVFDRSDFSYENGCQAYKSDMNHDDAEQLEKITEREQKIKDYPYTAVVACSGLYGDKYRTEVCFMGNHIDTQIEITNGNKYDMLQGFQLEKIGKETSDGLVIPLREHFDIKVQNAMEIAKLTLVVKNTQTNKVLFTKSVMQFGVISVKN